MKEGLAGAACLQGGRRAPAPGTSVLTPTSPQLVPSGQTVGPEDGRRCWQPNKEVAVSLTLPYCTKTHFPPDTGPQRMLGMSLGPDSLLQMRRSWLCAQFARMTDPKLERSLPDL